MMQNQNSNCYNIMFKLNGNNFGNMCVNEKMMFIEVVQNFNKCAQLKPENEATFSFNSNKIKPESSRTLKDLDIKENSIIEVTAKNIPINNAQNNQMNNNFPSMGTFQQGYQMSPQAGGMAQGMGGMAQGMGGMYQGMGGMYPAMGGMYPAMGGMAQGMGGMAQGMGGMAQGMGGMAQGMGGMYQGMGGMYPTMGGMYPAMGGMAQGMGGMAQGMGGMAQGMGGMAQGMGGMAQGMGGNATNTTGTSTNSSGTAGKTDNIGDDINWNIIFQGNGKIINVQATKDLKFSELATRFKNKAATNEVPTFFLNSFKIEENETRTLSQLGLHNQSKIDVVFQNSVIGAYY